MTIFVDAVNGNDSNDGLSANTPKKTAKFVGMVFTDGRRKIRICHAPFPKRNRKK